MPLWSSLPPIARIAALLIVVWSVSVVRADEAAGGREATRALAAIKDERMGIVDGFRRDGRLDADGVAALERRLEGMLEQADDALRAPLLLEIATIRRMTGRFREALPLYDEAASVADAHGDIDTAFTARMGSARAHAFGTKDHGAAAKAFGAAADTVGDAASREQRYTIADYASEALAGRGELEAALLNAVEARHLASNDSERFNASLTLGDVLQRLAQSCDYRKLVDALTGSDTDDADGFGACRRAVRGAQQAYLEARDAAEGAGWPFLAREAEGFHGRIALRLSLIEQQALFQQTATVGVFTATDSSNVLVDEDFSAGASALADMAALASLLGSVAAGGNGADARSLYLLGLKADVDGDPSRALAQYEHAAARLAAERASLFDLRQRGTVVENRPEFVRDLALRLLAFDRPAAAFQAFESIRARGLAQLTTALAEADLNEAERHWLAGLVDLDSRESALMTGLVETTIAGIEHQRADAMTERLENIRRDRRAHLDDPSFTDTLTRLRQAHSVESDLAGLRAAADASRVVVLLYWVTPTSVVVWAVSPGEMEIKTVFLPEVVLSEKVARLVDSVRSPEDAFDRQAAEELHAYLVQPFRHHFEDGQVLVVPQGPLVTLPFEALVDARTGRFLIEDAVVSYAPSAAFAQQALEAPSPSVDRVLALYDGDIERQTGEIGGIEAAGSVVVERRLSQDFTVREALAALDRHRTVHVLLHGEFDTFDPLQSSVSLNRPGVARGESRVTAADLLAVDWRDTALAVFSACEGARLNRRISNEVFGLSWPLFAGGVDAVVMSRWRVEARSNATWMAAFYAHLSGSDASPAVAAAMAMRTVIADGERHPYFWAGPQAFGR